MPEITKIVVGIGDDKATAGALAVALELAAEEEAELVLAHVIPIAGEQLLPAHDAPTRAVGNTKTPELLEAGIVAERAGIPHTLELLIGYAPRELGLLAEDVGASLIVVGSRHPTVLKPAFLGSTSRHLLNRVSCPVLVVPERVAVAA